MAMVPRPLSIIAALAGLPPLTIEHQFDVVDRQHTPAAQQTNLRQFYDGCNPRPMTDLVLGGGPQLEAGSVVLQCTSVDLLAGLAETI